MKETEEENQKIIDIVDRKTFQPGLRTEKEKPRLIERKGLFEACSRRDLVGIRYYSVSESNYKWLNHQIQAPQYSVRETDLRLPASFWL